SPPWGSNYLICIILWSIARVIFGVKSNFLPALREVTGRRSLEPRAVAVDVVGGAGEARAVAAYHRLERLIEAAAVDVGSGEPLACRGDAVAQPVEIDRGDPPVVDDEAAADHHARHRRAVLAVDQLVDRVVQRQPVRVVEV